MLHDCEQGKTSPREEMNLIRRGYKNVQNFWSHVTRVYQGSSSPVAILEEGPGYEVAICTLIRIDPL